MTRDEVIRMARETEYGWLMTNMHVPALERFAKLVAAAEREECARLVEPSEEHRRDASWGYIGGNEGVELLESCAAAIRARGEV
jgi:hypothetical protein